MEEMMDADLQTLAEQGIQITIEGSTSHVVDGHDDDGANSDVDIPIPGSSSSGATSSAAPIVTTSGGSGRSSVDAPRATPPPPGRRRATPPPPSLDDDDDGGENSASRFEGGGTSSGGGVGNDDDASPEPMNMKPDDEENELIVDPTKKQSPSEEETAREGSAATKQVAKTSIPQAMFHVFKANVGGGIFLLPTFYNEAGWLVGVILFLVIGSIVVDCTMMLLRVKNRIGRSDAQTYPSISRFVFGRQMKSFVTFALVVTQFGFCIMYLQYCASLFDEVFDFPFAYQFFVIFGFCLVTPMTFLTHKLHLLAFASMFATACVIFVIISSFLAGASTLLENGVGDVHVARPPIQWVLFMASCVTVLEGIGVILPVENSVKDKEKYPGAVKRMMTSIVAAYLVFGMVGQLAFGSSLHASVVHSMKPGLVATVARLALGVSLWLSYPIQYVPAIQIVDKAVRSRVKSDSPLMGMGLRIVLNLFFALGAFMIGADALELFVALIGSIAATALCITLPALLTLQVDRAMNGDLRSMSRLKYYSTVFSAPYTLKRVKCMSYVVLGVLVMIVGTIVAVHDMINLKHHKEQMGGGGENNGSGDASRAEASLENAIESLETLGSSYQGGGHSKDLSSLAAAERSQQDDDEVLGGGVAQEGDDGGTGAGGTGTEGGAGDLIHDKGGVPVAGAGAGVNGGVKKSSGAPHRRARRLQ